MDHTNEQATPSDGSEVDARPIVSVCMITYNHEAFIARALDGVLQQDVAFPIEVIVADDCSSDGTLGIVEKYQRRHPNVLRVLAGDRNIGAPANMARCLRAARGEFVAICEGDDFWTNSRKLETQVGVLRAHPETVLTFHDVDEVDAAGNTIGQSKIRRIRGRRSKEVLTPRDMICRPMIPTLSMVFRNKSDLLGPGWSGIVNGDIYLIARLSKYGNARYIDEVMGSYRHHAGGIWSSANEVRRYLAKIDSSMAIARDVDARLAIYASWTLNKKVGEAIKGVPLSTNRRAYARKMIEGYVTALKCSFRSGANVKSVLGVGVVAIAPFAKAVWDSVRKK